MKATSVGNTEELRTCSRVCVIGSQLFIFRPSFADFLFVVGCGFDPSFARYAA